MLGGRRRPGSPWRPRRENSIAGGFSPTNRISAILLSETRKMFRTIGIWVVAIAALISVALQIEAREQRADFLSEQRYQSCMAQITGGATNLLLLDASIRGGGGTTLFAGEGRRLAPNNDEAISRCSRRFRHTTTPTTEQP